MTRPAEVWCSIFPRHLFRMGRHLEESGGRSQVEGSEGSWLGVGPVEFMLTVFDHSLEAFEGLEVIFPRW